MSDLEFVVSPITDDQAQALMICSKLGHSTTPAVLVALLNDRLAAQSELAALREELADMQHWRDLALQFDNHRMTALWHLKTLAVNPSYAPAVSEFLASPPLPASEVVQRLTAAEQRNEVLEKGRNAAEDRTAEISAQLQLAVKYLLQSKAALNPTGDLAKNIGKFVTEYLKPTESGASE